MNTSAAAPAPVVTQEEMNLWFELTQKLSDIKAAEMELRKKIFAAYFTNPNEGTNTHPLSDGWVLKGQYKIDRKVDEAVLTTLSTVFKDHKIVVKDLVTYKPELNIRAYRDLDEEQQKLFNQALVIKPGSPAMEIVKPKR
jgi:hypothetical protein